MGLHTTATRVCHLKALCTKLVPFPAASNLQHQTSLPHLHIKASPVVFNRSISITNTSQFPRTTSPNYADTEAKPCPCTPCCGHGLPPPSNCPPKCIQYTTGYYYYPYGFWFCGPYHVTGPCCPSGRAPCPPCLPAFTPKCSCLCPSCTVCINPNALNHSLPPPKPAEPMPGKPRVLNELPEALKAFHKFHLKQQPKSYLGKHLPMQSENVSVGSKSKNIQGDKSPRPSFKGFNTKACTTRQSPEKLYPNLVLPTVYEFSPTSKPDSLQLACRAQLPTKHERDNPVFPSDGFSFSSIPKYNTPFPIPENGVDFHKTNSEAKS